MEAGKAHQEREHGAAEKAQIGLDIIGGDAHEVHEPHSEKAQHHRQKLYLFIHFDSV